MPFSGETFPNGHICRSCNKKRAKQYREQRKGLTDRRCRLTEEKVREIRRLHSAGKSIRGIAEAFEVSHNAIHAIVRGLSWKNV